MPQGGQGPAEDGMRCAVCLCSIALLRFACAA
jgi:hypothetical protein